MDVNNKIAVITGGSTGIGLSIIKKLLSCNVKYIAVFELDTPKTKEVLANLKKEFKERIDFYPCDVTNSSLINSTFDKVIETKGSVDILINNAGIFNETLPELMVDINLKGVISSTYAFIDRVGKHKNGNGGVIVNIASVRGLYDLGLPVYTATKHGVVSLTRSLKVYYDTIGIRVVAICPGYTETPLVLSYDVCTLLLEFMQSHHTNPKHSKIIMQSPDNVAAAVISIINEGAPGDVWISKDNLPPYPATITDMVFED